MCLRYDVRDTIKLKREVFDLGVANELYLGATSRLETAGERIRRQGQELRQVILDPTTIGTASY
jgi:RNA-splicing ligase RtcB